MYCTKCGKELPEGEKYCDCDNVEIEKSDSGQSNGSGSGLIVTIIGVLGVLCSFPFLMMEMDHYSYLGSKGLGRVVERNPLQVFIAITSVVILIVGLYNMFGKKS